MVRSSRPPNHEGTRVTIAGQSTRQVQGEAARIVDGLTAGLVELTEHHRLHGITGFDEPRSQAFGDLVAVSDELECLTDQIVRAVPESDDEGWEVVA
jgi:hypothetical protein